MLSQLNKSSTCFFDRKCDFLFILFRTDRDTIEETGDVVVSPWKILTLNLIVVQYSIFFLRGHGNESFNLIAS